MTLYRKNSADAPQSSLLKGVLRVSPEPRTDTTKTDLNSNGGYSSLSIVYNRLLRTAL